MQDEIIAIYEKEEDIEPLREKLKKFSFDELIKHPHFYYSLAEKGTDLQFIKDKYKELNKVELVSKREHKNSRITCDFFYVLDDNSYIVYAIAIDEEKPVLLNAFYV